MNARAQIVAAARAWIDTPFFHQGRTRGRGCDCGGLVGGVALELGLVDAAFWRAFDAEFGGYSRRPHGGTLERVCERYMRAVPRESMQPGDVALMRFRGDPQHLAILADYRHGGLSVVHAMARVGKVAEHRLSGLWASYIVGAYALPGVA